MSQVFSQKPWVMPEEPPRIKKIFEQHGKVLQYKKGAIFSHGSDNSSVYLVIKGLVTFGYFDSLDHYQVLSLILPGRSIGDLDSLALSVKITFATLSVLHGVVKHAIFAGVYR